MHNIIIIGNSGHRKVVEDVAVSLEYNLVGIIDDKYDDYFKQDGLSYGNSSNIQQMKQDLNAKLFFGIGNNKVRKTMFEKHCLQDSDFVTLISPNAVISKNVSIGIGTLVMPNVVINADAFIGKQSIINTSSIIEHDCIIKDFTHISPGAILTGGVKVEEGVQVGAGAVVNPLIKIGKWSVIGSGSSVIRHVDNFTIAVGSPAKKINQVEVNP